MKGLPTILIPSRLLPYFHDNLIAYSQVQDIYLMLREQADNQVPLSWDLRVAIALDVVRGLEYLHYGAVPPVVHRDIKSSNILLDQSMKAKIADSGLSRQDKMKSCSSDIRGTLGYVDPEYVVTRIC